MQSLRAVAVAIGLTQWLPAAQADQAFDPLGPLGNGEVVSVHVAHATFDLSPWSAGVNLHEDATLGGDLDNRDVLPTSLLSNGLSYDLGALAQADGYSGMATGASLNASLPGFTLTADAGWQIAGLVFTLHGRAGRNAF